MKVWGSSVMPKGKVLMPASELRIVPPDTTLPAVAPNLAPAAAPRGPAARKPTPIPATTAPPPRRARPSLLLRKSFTSSFMFHVQSAFSPLIMPSWVIQ